MLQDRKLLAFQVEQGEWTWSTSQIQSETTASDNVVQAVSAVQTVMKIAAVQWFRFDRDVVTAVASKEGIPMKDKSSKKNLKASVKKALKVAERKQGLIGEIQVTWWHADRVPNLLAALEDRYHFTNHLIR
jgi:predicted ATPase